MRFLADTFMMKSQQAAGADSPPPQSFPFPLPLQPKSQHVSRSSPNVTTAAAAAAAAATAALLLPRTRSDFRYVDPFINYNDHKRTILTNFTEKHFCKINKTDFCKCSTKISFVHFTKIFLSVRRKTSNLVA